MKKAVLLTATAVFLILSMSGVALAATPQEVYDDYAVDRSLDGSYSNGELQDYLSSATVHQYGDPTILSSLDSTVRILLASGRSASLFTGTQLILIYVGVVLLAGGGFVLWLLFRRRDLAYFIARVNVHDPDTYERFLAEADSLHRRYSATLLVADEAAMVLEGEWPATRTVLIAFPDEETAQSWYSSSEYQEIAKYRFDSSTADAVIVQAIDRGRGRRSRSK